MKSTLIFLLFACLLVASCKNEPTKSNSEQSTQVQILPAAKSVYKNENYKLTQAIDLGDFKPLGVAKFKEYVFISDTINDVVLRHKTDTGVTDTVCNKKVGYMTCEKARVSLPDFDSDTVFIYRGRPDLFKFDLGIELDKPISFSGKRIDDFVVIDQGLNAMIVNQQGNISVRGQEGSGDEDFKNPSVITYQELYILVADTGNKRIKVYDDKANYKFSFGQKILEEPKGVSTNGDQIFVCDTAKKEILVFNLEGEYQYSFNEGLKNPMAIYSEDNKLYISDLAEDEIKIYERDLTKM